MRSNAQTLLWFFRHLKKDVPWRNREIPEKEMNCLLRSCRNWLWSLSRWTHYGVRQKYRVKNIIIYGRFISGKKRGFKKDDEGCSSSFPVLWIKVINSARNFKEETSFARLSVAGRGITPSYNTFENKLFHSLQSQPVLPLKSCCSYCC